MNYYYLHPRISLPRYLQGKKTLVPLARKIIVILVQIEKEDTNTSSILSIKVSKVATCKLGKVVRKMYSQKKKGMLKEMV